MLGSEEQSVGGPEIIYSELRITSGLYEDFAAAKFWAKCSVAV